MSFFVRLATLMSIVLILSISTLFAKDDAQWPRNYLKTGEFLKTGQYIVSTNRAFFVIMQNTGRLEVFKGSSPHDHFGVFWSLNRTDKEGDFFATLQPDGNFVIYKGTGPSDNKGYHWDTHITSTGGEFFLVMQDDGNIAEYKGHGPNDEQGAYVWSIRQSVSRVTWLPDAKFLDSGSNYGGRLCEDLNRLPKSGVTIWAGGNNQVERWVLKDGMFIRAFNSDQCLDIDTKYHDDNRKVLKVNNCDKNSVTQKGWSYSKDDKRILNSAYPKGCLLMTDQFGTGWIHPRLATDGCPRWNNNDIWNLK